MKRTILTPSDIAAFTPIVVPFAPCSFRELFSIEYREGWQCIGAELYTAMVDAVADYSEAPEYETDTTYQPGDVVKFQGIYRRAKVSTTALPSLATDWEVAPRFTGDCADAYDTLFCSFLGPYLAYVVLSERLPYLLARVGDKGLNYGGRSYSAEDNRSVSVLKNALARDQQLAWDNLSHYLAQDSQKENDCFQGWKEYENDATKCGCGTPGCSGNCRIDREKVGGYDFG